MNTTIESTLPLEHFPDLGPDWMDTQQQKFFEETHSKPAFYLTFREDGYKEGLVTMVLNDEPFVDSILVTAPEDDLPVVIQWVKDNNPQYNFSEPTTVFQDAKDVIGKRKTARLPITKD